VLDARYDEVAISCVDARLDRLVMPDAASDRRADCRPIARRIGSYEDVALSWPPSLGKPCRGYARRSEDGREIDHLVLDGFVYDYLENPSGNGAACRRRAVPLRHRPTPGWLTCATQWLEGNRRTTSIRTSSRRPGQLARVLGAQGLS